VSLFGADIFPYSTSFAKLHLHTTFNISFPNNQQRIILTIGYSIKLMFNVFSFAFNVVRATCSFTKISMNYFLILIYLQLNYNLIVSWFSLQVKMFLETMVMYPPVVSVAGFTNVDRGLFRAVSSLTKELECCNKHIRLILLRNIVKNNLKICRGKLVQVRFDRLVYCTGIFTHIFVRLLLLMDGQKLGVLETTGF